MRTPLIVAAAAAVCLAVAPGSATAQVSVGVKAGMSYGGVSNSGVLPGNVDTRTGFAAGVGVNLGSPLGLGVEALYAQRGVESGTPTFSRKLNYLDVPAYVRFAFPTPVVSPFVYAGPQASFDMGCDSDGGACPSGRAKTSYAGIIGGGVKLSSVSLDARYVYGLTDLKLNTISSSTSYKTRSFMLLVGLGF